MKKNEASFNGKQTIVNMASQALSFLVNMFIGFFLTPYIVEHLGSTAYGFVGLANSFITYASLITTALNSMAGRFIAMSYFRQDWKNVGKYYSSVFIADIVICTVLSIPSVFVLVYLPYLIDIPKELVGEVTFLFFFTILEFMIQVISSAFGNSAYVLNRIDLVASRNIESKVLRVILILVVFGFFAPHLWYLGMIYAACSLYNGYRNYQIHVRLLPDVKIKVSDFDFRKIKELISSGVWNSISSLGSILTDGLDLLIVNTMVNSTAMGIVSIAKTLPLYISSILLSIASTFAPTLTKLYAEERFDQIRNMLVFYMKVIGGLLCIPFTIVVVFGQEFFSLWVPSQDSIRLWILAVLTVSLYPISLSFAPLGYVFTSANKVKINSLVTILFSLASVGTTFMLLSFAGDDLSKMIIVIISSRLFTFLQSIAFSVPYVSKIIHSPTMTFYLTAGKNLGINLIVCLLCFAAKQMLRVDSWVKMIFAVGVTVLVGMIVSWLLLLNAAERKQMSGSILKRKRKENDEVKL